MFLGIREFLQMMPEPQLSSGTSSKPVYCVNSSNALQWLKVLQDFWFDLEDELLVKSPPGKTKRMMVREDSPIPRLMKMMKLMTWNWS